MSRIRFSPERDLTGKQSAVSVSADNRRLAMCGHKTHRRPSGRMRVVLRCDACEVVKKRESLEVA